MGNHWKIIAKSVNVTGNLLENLLKPVENHEKHMKPIENYGKLVKPSGKHHQKSIGQFVKPLENMSNTLKTIKRCEA